MYILLLLLLLLRILKCIFGFNINISEIVSKSGFRPGYSGEFVFLETLVIFLIIGSEIIIELHVNGCEKLYLVLI